MESHVLTINAGPLKYVDVNGRQFAIARMTILQPKVLTGSKGALFYPRNEIESVYEEWNGRPLTIKHPNRNGSNVSANSPDIFINQEIGRFYNSKINSDGSNSGEGWFDVELTKRLHSELWNRLEKGEKVEVSTGLYTDNEEAPKGSQIDGTPYSYIARNYRPNHIAILPDEIGACSVKDGCGVFNADCGTGAGGFKPGNTCAKSQHSELFGETTEPRKNDRTSASTTKVKRLSKITRSVEMTEDDKKNLEEYTKGSDTFRRLNENLRLGQELNEGDKKIDETLEKVTNTKIPATPLYRGIQLSPNDADKFISEVIEDMHDGKPLTTKSYLSTSIQPGTAGVFAVAPQKEGETKSTHGRVGIIFEIVAHRGVYVTKELSAKPEEQEVILPKNSKFKIVNVASEVQYPSGKLTVIQVEQLDDSVTNAKVSVDIDKTSKLDVILIKSEDTSNKDSDDSKVTCAYCGTIQDKPDDGICPNCDKTINYIPNTQDAIMNRQVIIDWLTTNCACYKSADGKKKLEVLNDAALKEILIENAEKGAEVDADQSFLEWIGNADKEIKNAFVSMIKKKLKTAVGSNEFPVKEKKETPGATPPAPEDEEMKKKKLEEEQANKGTNNQASTMTVEQIQKAIFEHPVFKNIIANHTQSENTEKQKLIGQITATITDNNYKTQVINTLSQKSIDDLRLIASLTTVQPNQQTFPVANYFGASGAPVELTDNSYLQQEKLVVNEINWDEWSNLNSKVA